MKKTITIIVSSIALSFATVASAQTYTYEFTGTSATGEWPSYFVDGSTLTIENGSITDYNFEAPGYGDFGTPATTTVTYEDVSSYGPSGWSGELDLNYGIDIEVTGDSFASADLQSSVDGYWTAVPDGANSFALLGAVAIGLAASRPLLRRLS